MVQEGGLRRDTTSAERRSEGVVGHSEAMFQEILLIRIYIMKAQDKRKL